MRRYVAFIILCSLIMMHGSTGWTATQNRVGTRINLASLEGSSGRQLGMGNAFTAVSDDVNAMFSNPGGLGGQQYVEIMTSHQRVIENIHHSQVGIVIPLKGFATSNWKDLGTIGLALGFLDYGDFIGTDAAGNRTGDFGANDRVASLGYGKSLWGGLSIGTRIKYFQSRIAEDDVLDYAFDAGTVYRSPNELFSLGLSVINIGEDLQYNTSEDSLSQTILAGLAVSPFQRRLILSTDIVDPDADSLQFRSGVEFWMNHVLAFRAGYDSGYDLGDGVSVGVGLQFRPLEVMFLPFQRFLIDYAFLPAEGVSDEGSTTTRGTHHFSISLQFGEEDNVYD